MYTIAELSFMKDIPLCISKMEDSEETVKVEFDMPFSLGHKNKNVFADLRERMYSEELFHINFFNYVNDDVCKKFDDVAIESIKFLAQVENCIEIEVFFSGWWSEGETRTSPVTLGQLLAVQGSDMKLDIYNDDNALPQLVTSFEFIESKHNDKIQGKIEFFNSFIGKKEKVEDFFDLNKNKEQFNIDASYYIDKFSLKSKRFDLLNIKNADFRFYSKTVHKGYDKIVFNFSR